MDYQGTHEAAPLTPKEVSVMLGVSVRTLEKWRQEDAGPPYAKFNGRVWYKKAQIDTWLDSVWCPTQCHRMMQHAL